MQALARPRLSARQIAEMNLGFLGLQFSFGLQQSNMSPIYAYLGAADAALPLLALAGPVTGLVVQPLVGALSDRTASRWGRRTPYFLLGALVCSLCLLAMPASPTLAAAAALLWILDAANNVTMEPYRAYVGDRLDPSQQAQGFLVQSAFTGLAQTLSYLAPSLLVWLGMSRDALGGNHIPEITRVSFLAGAVLSVATMTWSIARVPELPLPPPDLARLRAMPRTAGAVLGEIRAAIADMPRDMRRLAWMSLFQWYAMACYWQYVVHAIARAVFGTTDTAGAGFREAVLANGQAGAFYNLVAFASALAMVPLARRADPARLHAAALAAGGMAMIALPQVHERALLFVPMVGIGLAWGSIMGNPYAVLARCVPPERNGVYMGLFNLFIVVPMVLQGLTLPWCYGPLLGGDPRQVLVLAGGLMLVAAVVTPRTR